MPFYEYECSACKHQTEVLQKISDAPLKKCPECGKQTLKRLMSAPVFRLKGGGWYETDFKSENETKRNLASSDEGSDSKSDEKSSESKESGSKKVSRSSVAKTSASSAKKAPAKATKPAKKKPATKPPQKKKPKR
jgi:putative FmdB family regulatory protein